MSRIGRAFVSILVFAAVFLSSYWLLFVQIMSDDPATLAALLTAAVLAALVWRAMGAQSSVPATVLTWSAVVGAIGFSGGFFGPMIPTPDANQGPLLGLFITGPLGCVAGAGGGLIFSLWRRLKSSVA